jgi:hypothetical protein
LGTTITITTRVSSSVGSSRPTTRTSARCTCGFSFIMFIIGAAMSVVIRAELFQPGLQFVKPEFFNQMTTMHALVMVFGGVMPAFVGLANWMIPLQIGAPDMALPRMNNFVLAAAGGLQPAAADPVPARRRTGRWLDAVPAAVAAGRPTWPSASSPSTWPASARSWARSTSSPPSSTCVRRA